MSGSNPDEAGDDDDSNFMAGDDVAADVKPYDVARSFL